MAKAVAAKKMISLFWYLVVGLTEWMHCRIAY